MRIAFTIFGGEGWTGGLNYLENLLSALAEYSPNDVQPILFAGTMTDPVLLSRLAPYLAEPPILSAVWNSRWDIRLVRSFCAFALQRDFLAEREFKRARIDLVFQHGAWYGAWFKTPTLAWIADFQHRRLPHMFSRSRYVWREVGYRALSYFATRILVSSQDAKRDCEKYYPRSIGRVEALPFTARPPSIENAAALSAIRAEYKLPDKFFFMPNQLWKHKNHLGIVSALREIGKQDGDVAIVACGNPKDSRHPDHPKQVLDCISAYELEKRFIFLGMIPYHHIAALMRLSAAVINPSFFEGWSTTVEEAKSVGAPLVLSNLPIHREQTEGRALFFDPNDTEDIAQKLTAEWEVTRAGPRWGEESEAAATLVRRREQFATNFRQVAMRVLQ